MSETPAEFFRNHRHQHQKALEMLGHPKKEDDMSKPTDECEHDFPTLRDANVNQSSHHSLSVYCRKCGVAKNLAKIDRHQ